MKKYLATFLAVLVFLAGLGVALYPALSDWVNARNASRAMTSYDDTVGQIKQEDFSAYFAEADAYNRRLTEHENPMSENDRAEGYEEAFRVDDSGIMGYIEIPRIGVRLPFYHGTSGAVLNVAIGHIEGSSLPTGEPGTHAVLSGHRGLPNAQLFTDLPELGKGDIFILTVLDRKMTYMVDQMETVLPDQMDSLRPVAGEDLVTLVTCTPYGINTHRLLVRGHRIPNLPEEEIRDIPVTHMERELTTQEKLKKYMPYGVAASALLFLIALPMPAKKKG